MPHRCVHCGSFYDDGSKEVLYGCSCGSKFFFYLTQGKLDKIKTAKEDIPLTKDEREQVEEDVRDILNVNYSEETSSPIILDFESIKVLKPGKYVIDLHNLFTKDRPLVYTLEDGKYFVDLTSQILAKKGISRKDI